MNGKKIRKVILYVASAALAAGAFFAVKNAEKITVYPCSRDTYLLDTFCSVTVYEGGGEEALTKAMDALEKYDELFDPEDERSDIYAINHRKSDRVEIDEETYRLLSETKKIEAYFDGNLTVGIRPLSELWDIKNRKELPSEADILEAANETRCADWNVAEDGETFLFLAGNAKTKIETGAVAKGFIADRIREILLKEGVTSAIIDLGGNIHTLGSHEGSPFKVGIQDTKGEKEYLKLVEVEGESVVTAGNYERYFEVDGKRYHHILDPATGWPAQTGLASVTVIGPSSMYCDGLATGLFVSGYEEAVSILEEVNRGNDRYRAIFITDENELIEVN